MVLPIIKPGSGSWSKSANVAHLVERHLAMVEVASSILVVRSNFYKARSKPGLFSVPCATIFPDR